MKKKSKKSTKPKRKWNKNECWHCKIKLTAENRKSHDCSKTTEQALTEELPEQLMDAWLKLREAAVVLGEQRIYASFKSIMFSKKSCYFFVRPSPKRLELCLFLGRTLKHSFVKKSQPSSKVKVGHIIHITHPDEVESPLTDWLKEAYEFCPAAKESPAASPQVSKKPKAGIKTWKELVGR